MSFEIIAYLKKNQLKEDHPPFNFNTFLHINYLSSSFLGLGFEQVWHSLLALIRQLHNCANVIWSLKRSKRSSYFYLDYFSFSKSFDHIAKDVSVLYLKLDGNHRLSYLQTFITSKHLSSPR